MKAAPIGRQKVEKLPRVFARVDDAQDLRVDEEAWQELSVSERAKLGSGNPSQPLIHRRWIVNNFGGAWEPDTEVLALVDRWLGGCAQDDAGMVMGREMFEAAKTCLKVFQREALCFVEDHDGAGDPVQLAALGAAVCVEGLEKLDVGGDNDARVPVL